MLWAARPVIVVEDRESFLAVWCPKGTRRKVPTTPPTRPMEGTRGERLATCLELRDWVLVDQEWDVSTLMLTDEGTMHSIWVSWLESGEHWGWYVNLQTTHAAQLELPCRRWTWCSTSSSLRTRAPGPGRTRTSFRSRSIEISSTKRLPPRSGPKRRTSFVAHRQTSRRFATPGPTGARTPHGASRASPTAGIAWRSGSSRTSRSATSVRSRASTSQDSSVPSSSASCQ